MRGHSRLYRKQWYDINGIQLHPTMKDNFTNINHNLKKHLELSFEIPKKVTNTTYLFFRIRIYTLKITMSVPYVKFKTGWPRCRILLFNCLVDHMCLGWVYNKVRSKCMHVPVYFKCANNATILKCTKQESGKIHIWASEGKVQNKLCSHICSKATSTYFHLISV